MIAMWRACGLSWMLAALATLSLASLALMPAHAHAQAEARNEGAAFIDAVRAWSPPPGQDNLEAARAAFDSGAGAVAIAGNEFQVSPNRPAWYAITLGEAASAQPLTLDLTHPSIRSASLHVPAPPGGAPLEVKRGRDAPVQDRANARFPASFELPPAGSAGPRTVYVRVVNAVPARGRFLLQPQVNAEGAAGTTRLLQGGSLVISLLAALFATWRAVRMRSAAWAFFAVMCATAGLARIFIAGFAESWLWPALSPYRGQVATSLASFAVGSTLLLFRSAFMLEVRAPMYSRALLVMGLACPVLGLTALLFKLPVQQALTQVIAAIAIVMGLSSIVLAWRTANRVALWLLGGFGPVAVGATLTTLGTAGALAYEPWMLLVTPLASLIEIPMNVRGLQLLERRRAAVRMHRAKVAQGAGPAGETRPALAARLMQAGTATSHAPSTLMLLRFEGLAPGTATLREMDAVNVERYLNSILEFAVHAGNLTGRWSFHELPLLRIHQQSTSGVSGLLTALFAQGLRSDSYEIKARDVSLRIAYGRFDGREMPVAEAMASLCAALDDRAHAGQRRIELDLKTRRVIPPAPRATAFPSPG
ncbi:MAG: membrane protein [Comamonadaceae bacterium]|nr:MAG: membrane protein [Comamonadaceae bacterium]